MAGRRRRSSYLKYHKKRVRNRTRGRRPARTSCGRPATSRAGCPPSHRGRDPDPPLQGGHCGDTRLSGSLSLSHIHSAQAHGGLEGHIEPETVQYFRQTSEFPNGNSSFGSATDSGVRLGDQYRSAGRLPPCPDGETINEISRVSIRPDHVRLPMPAFRTSDIPMGLHAHCSGSNHDSPSEGYKNFLLPRRLDYRGQLSGSGLRAHPTDPGLRSGPGVHCQLEKVLADSLEHSNVLGGGVRLPFQEGLACPSQGLGTSVSPFLHSSELFSPSPPLASPLGTPCQLRRSGPQLPSVHEASTNVLCRTFLSGLGPISQAHSLSFRASSAASALDTTFVPHPRVPLFCPSPRDDARHGCLSFGVGCPSRGPTDGGCVGGNPPTTHQRVGTEGCFSSLEGFRVDDRQSVNSSNDRQHFRGLLSQPSGGSALIPPRSFGDGHLALVPSPWDFSTCSAHPGRGERPRRHLVATPTSPYGLVTQYSGFQPDLPPSRFSFHRPVCGREQPPDSGLLFSEAGSLCPGSRRPRHFLVQHSRVCLPSCRPHSEGVGEGIRRSGLDPPYSPVLEDEDLVPHPSSPSVGPTAGPPSPQGSSQASIGSTSPPPIGGTPSGVLAARRQGAVEAGFSLRAAEVAASALRPSSRRIYDSRIRRFESFCEGRGFHPSSAPLGTIADFFLLLFDEDLSPRTIVGYRSAIAAIHRGFADGSSVSSSSHLSDLVKGLFLRRPPSRPLFPPWDVRDVLRVLRRPPFEPLNVASLKHVAWKAVFLVALASGRRQSTLAHLSHAPGHIRWEREGVRLRPTPTFVAKNQSLLSGQIEIFIPRLYKGNNTPDKLVCPVRALKYYCKRLRSKSECESHALFVSPRAPHPAVGARTLARWICKVIELSSLPDVQGRRPRAHQVRAISSSLASHRGASLEEVMAACSWRTSSSFIRFYLLDISAAEASYGRRVLASSRSPSR